MVEKPYFAEGEEPPLPETSDHFSILTSAFLARLDGPARIELDPRQELLVMQLRARCASYAFSEEADDMIRAINQLVAFYHTATRKAGKKVFEVLNAIVTEHAAVQEQIALARRKAFEADQRVVARTQNQLLYYKALVENPFRKLISLATLALDVINDWPRVKGQPRWQTLSPSQYLDLGFRAKVNTLAAARQVLAATRQLLVDPVDEGIRNAIAHERYEIQEDGSVHLYNYRSNERIDLGTFGPGVFDRRNSDLEASNVTLEISLLIFQHNHCDILAQLFKTGEPEQLSDKKIMEFLYLEAPGSYLRVTEVEFNNATVKIVVQTCFPPEVETGIPSTVHGRSKNRRGQPVTFSYDIPPPRISARGQTARLLQRASFYCGRYERISITTQNEQGQVLGEMCGDITFLRTSTEQPMPFAEFLAKLEHNTFPAD